jgi:hypothetical protein
MMGEWFSHHACPPIPASAATVEAIRCDNLKQSATLLITNSIAAGIVDW